MLYLIAEIVLGMIMASMRAMLRGHKKGTAGTMHEEGLPCAGTHHPRKQYLPKQHLSICTAAVGPNNGNGIAATTANESLLAISIIS